MSKLDPELIAAIKAAIREVLPEQPTEWLTTEEVSALTKIPRATLEKWRANNKGPPAYQPAPRTYRYKRAEVDAHLSSFLIYESQNE